MSKGNLLPFLPAESALQTEGLLHTRGMAASGLRPVGAIFPTAASVGSPDRVSSSSGLVILSDQQGSSLWVSRYPPTSQSIWAHLMARGPKVPSLVLRHAVLATVSSSYPPPSGSFPDITHRPPLVRNETASCFAPSDLHVLGLPPAFQSEP